MSDIKIKERPILFSGPMVRANLEDRKSQTRRIVKGMALDWLAPDMFKPEFVADPNNGLCPYGQPGDRLWVRETWCEADYILDGTVRQPATTFGFKADLSCYQGREKMDTYAWNWDSVKWKPSIHMPRAACRLLLEITDVRVERLQDISEADAKAEGIESFRPVPGDGPPETTYKHYGNGKFVLGSPIHSFRTLWQSINGPESWDANPWVWVIEFKRIAP